MARLFSNRVPVLAYVPSHLQDSTLVRSLLPAQGTTAFLRTKCGQKCKRVSRRSNNLHVCSFHTERSEFALVLTIHRAVALLLRSTNTDLIKPHQASSNYDVRTSVRYHCHTNEKGVAHENASISGGNMRKHVRFVNYTLCKVIAS